MKKLRDDRVSDYIQSKFETGLKSTWVKETYSLQIDGTKKSIDTQMSLMLIGHGNQEFGKFRRPLIDFAVFILNWGENET